MKNKKKINFKKLNKLLKNIIIFNEKNNKKNIKKNK